MTPARQPPYEMQDGYILTKEKWIELCEHLTIGCTNQKKFLDSLEATHTPAAPDSGGNRAAAIRSRKVTNIGNGALLVDPVCRCNSCKIPTDQCKGKTTTSDITKVKTRELIDELSKRTGVRLHTVGHKMYCRVFVGECDTGTILTWQTEHSEAYVLVFKP